MMTSDRYPIRTIFRKFYPEYLESTSYVSHEAKRAAECIMKCKTGELGYTVDVCEECGYPKIYAVSCNNKACPCCQAPLAKKWELERNTELIENISYYHVVFTVPHELNLLIQANEKLLLDLLFRCVTETGCDSDAVPEPGNSPGTPLGRIQAVHLERKPPGTKTAWKTAWDGSGRSV